MSRWIDDWLATTNGLHNTSEAFSVSAARDGYGKRLVISFERYRSWPVIRPPARGRRCEAQARRQRFRGSTEARRLFQKRTLLSDSATAQSRPCAYSRPLSILPPESLGPNGQYFPHTMNANTSPGIPAAGLRCITSRVNTRIVTAQRRRIAIS
jgi:hypothetical protein